MDTERNAETYARAQTKAWRISCIAAFVAYILLSALAHWVIPHAVAERRAVIDSLFDESASSPPVRYDYVLSFVGYSLKIVSTWLICSVVGLCVHLCARGINRRAVRNAESLGSQED